MELSIVIPFFGCHESLDELCVRLEYVRESLGVSTEVIFVIDGIDFGLDKTQMDSLSGYGFDVLQLVKNVGQHSAIRAGLSQSSGEFVAVMDCDLQDPPEFLISMFQAMGKDCDVIQTKRRGNYDSLFRRLSRKLAEKLIALIYPKGFDLDNSSYVLMRREVVQSILESKGHDHLGLILNWLKYPTIYLEYERQERLKGKSSYNFRRLINHALEAAAFDFTHLFQRLTKVSVLFILVSAIVTIWAIVSSFVNETSNGWTSIIALLALSSSIILAILSLIGMALSLFIRRSQRPQYVVYRQEKKNG